MFNQVEKLQQEFTDKYVEVDPRVPELRRFEGHVGQVKTVNMSGRALVQFDAWNNIGWYDIDPGFLRIVPKPAEGDKAKAHEAKKEAPRAAAKAEAAPAAVGEKKLSPLEMARMQGAAKPATEKAVPAAGAKQSTADILAAARANKATAPATGAPAAKKSTADILAAARANKSADSPAAEAAAPKAPAAAPPKPAAANAADTAAAPQLAPGVRPSVSEILAWCRSHDAK